jgi:hypothetical protein
MNRVGYGTGRGAQTKCARGRELGASCPDKALRCAKACWIAGQKALISVHLPPSPTPRAAGTPTGRSTFLGRTELDSVHLPKRYIDRRRADADRTSRGHSHRYRTDHSGEYSLEIMKRPPAKAGGLFSPPSSEGARKDLALSAVEARGGNRRASADAFADADQSAVEHYAAPRHNYCTCPSFPGARGASAREPGILD